MTNIRVICAITAQDDLLLEQIDVDSAFLNGVIDAEVYMTQPLRYEDSLHPTFVCCLNKRIYGLKQAGHIWYKTARLAILAIRLVATTADLCVFTANWTTGKIIIGLYINDFIIAGTKSAIYFFKQEMATHFRAKTLGKRNLSWESKLSKSHE
jgi:hypothetical protein